MQTTKTYLGPSVVASQIVNGTLEVVGNNFGNNINLVSVSVGATKLSCSYRLPHFFLMCELPDQGPPTRNLSFTVSVAGQSTFSYLDYFLFDVWLFFKPITFP